MKRTKASNKKNARGKATAKRAIKRGGKPQATSGAPNYHGIESLMMAQAEALRLTIDPAWRDGVKFHLQLVLSHAARVDEFALPDEAEPAAVFRA